MTKPITTSALYYKVVEIAELNPAMTYQIRLSQIMDDPGIAYYCNYQVLQKPACIVGFALKELGMSIEDLEELDAYYGGIDIAVEKLEDEWFVNNGKLDELIEIQTQQDRGQTWMDAVKRATTTS